jgi:hypothetical protein
VIGRQEILEFAREVRLDPNVVERDHVLGWMLAGISPHPRTRGTWLFKGGTCLKKCYFVEPFRATAVSRPARASSHFSAPRRTAIRAKRSPGGFRQPRYVIQ